MRWTRIPNHTAKDPCIELYHKASQDGLTGRALQCGALANVAQYRLSFSKALSLLSSSGAVLDWRCGNGHFSSFLTHHGFRTVRLSFDQSLDWLKPEPLYTHACATEPVSLSFEDRRFTAAVIMRVLEHVHETRGDQLASLLEFARVLEPGGKLLVFHLPNRYTCIVCLVRQINSCCGIQSSGTAGFSRRPTTSSSCPPHLSIVECALYNTNLRNPANALPAGLRDSPSFVAGFNLLDDGPTALLPVFAQNWFLVLRKR